MKFIQHHFHRFIVRSDKGSLFCSPEQWCMTVSDLIAHLCNHMWMMFVHCDNNNLTGRDIYRIHGITLHCKNIILIQTPGQHRIIQTDSEFCASLTCFSVKLLKRFIPVDIHVIYFFSGELLIRQFSQNFFTNHCMFLLVDFFTIFRSASVHLESRLSQYLQTPEVPERICQAFCP